MKLLNLVREEPRESDEIFKLEILEEKNTDSPLSITN
jgi:hypothetical protein